MGKNTSTSIIKVWNDVYVDKNWQEPSETEEQVNTAVSQNYFIPVLGQATMWFSENDSVSSNANNTTNSKGWTSYQWNDQGQMVHASGATGGKTTTENADGTQQSSEFTTTNTYAIVWGQAVVTNAVTVTVDSNVAGTSTTRTITDTAYEYRNGELVGARATKTPMLMSEIRYVVAQVRIAGDETDLEMRSVLEEYERFLRFLR